MKPFHVYILRCGDGTYYTGHTDNLEARLQQHHHGEVGYTARRKPVEVIWAGEFETREGALAFEQQVKGWSREKKEALMAGDWERVQALAAGKRGRDGLTQPGGAGLVGGLRQAQPERTVEAVGPQENAGWAEPVEASHTRSHAPVRAEPVEAPPTQHPLAPDILAGQRRAIAKAITLLESTRPDHRAQADELLTAILPRAGKAFRLGISGVPGVGKSTFIEALGLSLIAQGHRVAVLAIDPSSSVSGGSILGDKTRMEHLSVHEHAFIRPSPSSGTLGGVAEKTREAMLVCEAAGYDIVIVETVGVGQSETAVAGMTDMFVLMQLPNAGDDLQAIKKGVMELADLVVINKADIDADAATRAQGQITSALRLFTQHGRAHAQGEDDVAATWRPEVLQLSALKSDGIDRFWSTVARYRDSQQRTGRLQQRRRQQATAWMWERIESGLKQAFRQNPAVRAVLQATLQDVQEGRLAPSTAARQLLHKAAE